MNLLLKNNSSPIIIIFFLSMIFVSCAIQRIEIPKPDLTMANKIQFDAESKEIWVYDFQGQGHYFNHATKNVINVYTRSGNAYNDGFLTDPALSSEIVAAQGDLYVDLYENVNLANRQHYTWDFGNDLYSTPRTYKFGASINF